MPSYTDTAGLVIAIEGYEGTEGRNTVQRALLMGLRAAFAAHDEGRMRKADYDLGIVLADIIEATLPPDGD